ncbi:MAG: energy transducer TonB [Bacteroidota bacterium]|nr:energy transducer TonB [Bacteroidota bacterium]
MIIFLFLFPTLDGNYSNRVQFIQKTLTGKEYEIKNRRVMYPEGDHSLLEFIAKNIRYPISAQERKISGKVFIEATIDSRGNIKEAKILIGAHKDLDNEALRVVRLITKWLPELQNGIPVESSLTIPVSFKLN